MPPAWSEATVRAAVATLNSTITALGVSAAAQQLAQEVFKVMLLQKIKLASATLLAAGLIGWGASAALVSLGQTAPKGTPAPAAPAGRPAANTALPQPKPASADTEGMFPVRGRVLDPDGKPVAGAQVHVRPYAEPVEPPMDPTAGPQKAPSAVTDADGRFQFELDKTSGGVLSDGGPGWHKSQIVAAARGFAPAWVEAGDLAKGGEAILHLVRDDVPVRGRVLDSQGRPVAGVVVRLRVIGTLKDGVDLDAMLASGQMAERRITSWYGLDLLGPPREAEIAPVWTGGPDAWITGADGGFEIQGIGRDRVARLNFHGGGVADGTLDVIARAPKTPPKARPATQSESLMFGRDGAFIGVYPQRVQLVGATFDYIASPSKPFMGVVRLKGSGKPVAGALVRVADAATHTIVTVRTDDAGRFRLNGVPKGEFYQLSFNPRTGIDRFLRHTVIVDDTEGLKPIEQTIELCPGVIVTGRLVDSATGRAVPPAYISYFKTPDNVNPGEAPRGSPGWPARGSV